MSNISFLYRKLSDTKIPNEIKDINNLYNDSTWKIEVLKQNPFLKEINETVFQIFGLVDNEIVGSETHFPIILELDKQEYPSVSGHGLSVSVNHRGLGLGTRLTDQRLDYSNTKSLLLCDASQMHLPILKKLGAIIFLMPRMILLRHSFSVIENKTNKIIAKCLAPIVDIFLKIPYRLVKRRIRKKTRKLCIRELERAPGTIENIISSDLHPFKEKHSCEWFNWVKNYSLVEDNSIIKKLYGVYHNNELVGFFMTKQRFYPQASHRGYKNVVMGSIMEWGTINNSIITDNDLCLLALLSFDKEVDAIELCCTDEESAKYFKKLGLIQVGNGNVVIRYRNNSPLNEIKYLDRQSNWRLRPAMGDNSLS